jgi:hypothetical protein
MSCIKTIQIALCVGIVLACCHTVLADSITPPAANYSWLFDDGSGSTATAATGGNNGTLESGAAWSTVVPISYAGNGSVDFSAGNVSAAGHTMGTSGTISLWARSTEPLYASNKFLIDTAESTRTCYLFVNADGLTQTKVNSVLEDDSAWINNTNFTANTWHHLAWVWDNAEPTDKVKMYLDGALTHTSSTAVGDAQTPDTFFFGSRLSSVFRWQGQMDEIAFWNTPLSASNVTWLSTHSLTGAAATPEPGAMALAITGLIGLLAYAWRKRR